MNYWLLTTEYPPFYGGGISTYCYHTAEMLSQNGHKVSVFIPDEKVKDCQIDQSGSIRLIRFNTSRTRMTKHLGFAANLSYEFAAITREIIQKEGKPDCIESQEYLGIAYHIMQFKLLKYPDFENVPVILTLHSPAFLYLHYNREGTYSFPNYWIGEIEKNCIQCADWIIAPSQYIVDEIIKHTPIDKNKVSVIRNPYASETTMADEQKITRNKIVFFGKLSPQKGVFELFSYFKKLWDKGFTYPLIIIGGTEKVYYPEMQTMGQIIQDKYTKYIAKKLVQFEGRILPQKKEAYLSDAHVILIPSMNDNLPYAAIEAMELGKIVLASMQGGQAEIIEDGKNGFLFDHNKAGDFENKLIQILALSDDELIEIGKTATQTTKQLFSYKNIFEAKIAVIDKVCKVNAASPAIFPFTRPTFPQSEIANINLTAGMLSVIITYFNSGLYITECVQSILKSTYKDIEIIIVDDGSTDQLSIDALKEFEKNKSVTVFHKINEGLPYTRNFGAQKARGEFLTFIDADDKVYSDYYSKAITVLKNYQNIFFVGAWVQYFGSSNEIWPTWNPEPPYILLHNSVNSSSLVSQTNAFLKAGINDKNVDYGLEDFESVINMLANGFRGVVIPECLFWYRVRKDSMYRRLTKYKILYSYQYIAEKHATFYSSFAAEIFNLLNANGPSFNYDNPTFGIEIESKIIYPNGTVNTLKKIIKRKPVLKKIILRIAGLLKIKLP